MLREKTAESIKQYSDNIGATFQRYLNSQFSGDLCLRVTAESPISQLTTVNGYLLSV